MLDKYKLLNMSSSENKDIIIIIIIIIQCNERTSLCPAGKRPYLLHKLLRMHRTNATRLQPIAILITFK